MLPPEGRVNPNGRVGSGRVARPPARRVGQTDPNGSGRVGQDIKAWSMVGLARVNPNGRVGSGRAGH